MLALFSQRQKGIEEQHELEKLAIRIEISQTWFQTQSTSIDRIKHRYSKNVELSYSKQTAPTEETSTDTAEFAIAETTHIKGEKNDVDL